MITTTNNQTGAARLPSLLVLALVALLGCSSDAKVRDDLGAQDHSLPVDQHADQLAPDIHADGAQDMAPDSGPDAASADTAGETSDLAAADLALGHVFDPAQVYLIGTLYPGSCIGDAIAPIAQPTPFFFGIDCYADRDSAVIRPTDGALLFTDDETLYHFQPDGVEERLADVNYPSKPYLNDLTIDTPCPNQTGVRLIRVAPDGRTIYRCGSADALYDQANGGQLLAHIDRFPIHLGNGGLLLVNDYPNLGLRSLDDPSVAITVTIEPRTVATVRATQAGFRIVKGDQLWDIAADGTTTQVGTYPALPANVTEKPRDGKTLSANGDLYRFARIGSDDVIVKQTIGGTSEVVYEETAYPVKIHTSELVTGP